MNIGDKVPHFSAIDQDGEYFSSEDLEGTPYVIYFYPKDDTPGCTTEACSFRDNLERIESNGVTVIGVSPDSPDSHQKFMEKHALSFPLLADEDRQLCTLFGVIQPNDKLERTTFLIDSHGIIRWIERPVQVEGHVDRTLKAMKEMIL